MSIQIKSWHPELPTSKGATAYHDAVINASWNNDNIIELIKIVQEKIREEDIVVDFGAGTGASALRLLEKVKFNLNLWLVDNSASWLAKAYEILKHAPNIKCFLLEKMNDAYPTLSATIGKETANHVLAANVVHLIPDLNEAFNGVNDSLKQRGTFTFGSGNIFREDREEGILMMDDTVEMVHNLALEILRSNNKFTNYRRDLENRIEIQDKQRKAIFPVPRALDMYLKALKNAGFNYEEPQYRLVKVKYKDWLNFLRVKRLEAGILPEIGGKEPTLQEEKDRDKLIVMATKQLFKKLGNENPYTDNNSFTAEWVYVKSEKVS